MEISTALVSIRALSDITKGVIALSKDVAVKAKASELLAIIISLQNDMLSMQSEYTELLIAKSHLEDQLMKMNQWSDIESQYALIKLRSGVLVYSPSESNKSPRPLHWLCANCFGKQKKSVLQKEDIFLNALFCPECTTTFSITEEDKKQFSAG